MKGRPDQRELSEISNNWRILSAVTVGSAFSAVSLLTASFGTFIIPLSREFGWTRGEIGLALLFMTAAQALMSPPLGTLLDRHGTRKLVLLSIPFLACALLAIAGTNGALPYYYFCFVVAIILGGGTAPVSYSRAVNETFVHKRGMALGIMFSGMGFAAAFLPIFSTIVTENLGWRWSYAMLAILALIAFPGVYLGMPQKSEQAAAKDAESTPKASYAFFRNPVFWTIGLACSLASLASYGLLVSIVPMLTDSGLTPSNAARYAALVGFSSASARLLVGLLLDRIFAPYIAATILMCSAAGCILFLFFGLSAAPLLAVLIGLSFGMEVDLVSFLVARYFGIKRYGLIYGIIYSCFSASAAFGPAIAGFIFDAQRSYDIALGSAAVIMILATVVFLLLPKYPVPKSD